MCIVIWTVHVLTVVASRRICCSITLELLLITIPGCHHHHHHLFIARYHVYFQRSIYFWDIRRSTLPYTPCISTIFEILWFPSLGTLTNNATFQIVTNVKIKLLPMLSFRKLNIIHHWRHTFHFTYLGLLLSYPCV